MRLRVLVVALALLIGACRAEPVASGVATSTGTTAPGSASRSGPGAGSAAQAAVDAACGEDPFAVAAAVVAMPWGSPGARPTPTTDGRIDDEVEPLALEASEHIPGGGPGPMRCRVDSPPAPGVGPGAVLVALQQRRFLLVGGSQPGAVVRPTTRAYLRAGGSWTAVELAAARTSHTATALADGGVLVTGGFQSAQAQALRTAELFDPAASRFVSAGNMRSARANHAAALLPDGRVLIVGGQDERAALLPTTELYDPARGEFVAGSEHGVGQVLAAVALADGRVLVIGAQAASVFDLLAGTFSPVGKPPVARAGGASAVRLSDGRVLVTGGFSGARSTALGEVFDPGSGVFTSVGPMQAARRFHLTLALPDGRAWILGGIGEDGSLLDTTELFDPKTGTFAAYSVKLARPGEPIGAALRP